ncbi:MAG: benzoate-CoA ligase family protein [Betaproteobacteria bacterium]|nr:benzoate-CoA ligase family protein [Betaproteobacteria bacterium]
MTSYTGHLDTFARDNLPPRHQWPELIFELPELRFGERLNCATELLDRAVADSRAERVALRTASGVWTYRELSHRTNRVARVLAEDMGLLPGNRVLLHAPNNPMLAVCWFAVLKAGGIPVPTMPLLRNRELAVVVRKANISHAIVDKRLAHELEEARAQCPMLRQVKYFHDEAPDSIDRLAQGKPPVFAGVDTAADDVALITFTSGTTGLPKGTMHLHRDVMATCECFPKYVLRHSDQDIVARTPPIAFTYGLGGLLHFPLRYGASAVLIEQYTPESLLETVERHRVTVLYTAPTMYRAMAEIARNHDLGSLRACVSAGEALPVRTRAAWEQASGVRLIDGIGSSEMLYMFIAAAGEDIRPGATGKVIPGYRATVLDDAGKPCRPGVVGRLAVKGPTGCRYLNDERQATYVHDGWNFTGDAYLLDEDGYFWYQARTDDMIISAGYNIACPEVEGALLTHPAVAECAVVGAADEQRGQIVKAYVVLEQGYGNDEDMVRQLQEHVKRAIAPYKYPRAIVFMRQLPRTETGKLQRFKLCDPGLGMHSADRPARRAAR